MGAIITAIRTFGGGLLERGTQAVTGLSLRAWLYIAGAAASALFLWLAYSWAWNRGADHQKAADAKEISQLSDNVKALQAGITQANAQAAAAQAAAKAAEAKAAATVTAKLKDVEKARAKEAARGPGADQMNAFLRENFGAGQ
jgi:hypothetical protein